MVFDQLWRLQRLRKHTARRFLAEISRSRSSTERQRIECEMQFELEVLDDDLRVAWTRRLETDVVNFDIPIPSDSQSWGTHRTTGEGFLNDAIRDGLKQQVRKYQKDHRDSLKDIVLLISGILGFIQLAFSLIKSLYGR